MSGTEAPRSSGGLLWLLVLAAIVAGILLGVWIFGALT